MTAAEILAEVEKQFQVLHLEAPQKNALLAQALRVCQTKIGPSTTITVPGGSIDTPADFLDVATAADASGRWQEVRRVRTAAIPAQGDTPETPATDKLVIVGYPQPAPVPTPVPANLRLTTTYDPYYNTGRVAATTATAPFTVVYFLDLTASGVEIPPSVVPLLFQYLHALLEIPNNQRARQVALATGMQGEFPSDEELKARKDAIEAEMEESAAIIPSVAVF